MSVTGKYLAMTVNGAVVASVAEWDGEEGGDDLDATTGSTGGYTDTDTGPDDLTVNFTIAFDTTTGSYVGLKRGTILANVRLFRKDTDPSPAFYLPIAIVTRSRKRVPVRGRVEFTGVIKNKGAYESNDP